MGVNADEHIGLVGHMVKRLGLRGDMAEEGFSEGLVALTVAAKSYDPTRGTPVASWLAKNIQWSLLNWIARQKHTMPLPNEDDHNMTPSGLRLKQKAITHSREALASRVELSEALSLIESLLTSDERLVVLGKAYGYKGKELARHMCCSEVQISRLYHRGTAKIREAMK